jgi:hypothetical protein
MVVERINEVKDLSEQITISVFMDTQLPNGNPAGDHHDFQVNVEDGWVCSGGGATGKEMIVVEGSGGTYGALYPANYLTASFPSVDSDGKHDFKGWRVMSRDHIHTSSITLTAYAIGIKIKGLSNDALIANLRVFPGVAMPVSHPDLRSYLDQGFVLLGGGFHVVDQLTTDPGHEGEQGRNIGTGSFPDSTVSWKGRSQDIELPTASSLKVFAIGIRSTLFIPDPLPNDPSHRKTWDVITSYSSMEFLNNPPASPGSFNPVSVAQPLQGFALCGGGGVAHPGPVGDYLWALEPTTLNFLRPADGSPRPVRMLVPSEQTFTTRSTSYKEIHTNTSYAMGVKIQPSLIPAPPLQACNIPVPIGSAESSGTETTNEYAIDGDKTTYWLSTDIKDPYLQLLLSQPSRICRADIIWVIGEAHYFFTISVSLDGNDFTCIFTGTGDGETGLHQGTKPQTYTFPEVMAKYVKISIIQSNYGQSKSKSAIAEIALYRI